MPHKDVNVVCRNCRTPIQETVWYQTDEELALQHSKENAKFYSKIWGGVFVFGITVLLFIWALVLMLKTFEMKKLDKVLSDPNVEYEDTWYNKETDNPAFKSDTVKVIKGAKSKSVEILQKELDQAKQNASKDRESIRQLLQDTDQLIKAYKELEKLTQEKKKEVDKLTPSEEKK